ncbi:MAG TPA: hypothetical protein VD969_21570 [Symbiobacteriaceae bacterium]|nr:hypothetical protein [Symbiobacteriaceae bacterium]
MRRLIVLLLVLTALAAGCGTPDKPEVEGAVVVVLVDMTTSAVDDANSYMKNFTTVLNAARGGEEIFVVPITGSFVPQIHTSSTMPAASFNPVSDAEKLKDARLKLQNDVARLLGSERPKEPGTAILSGIAKAAAIFAAEGKGRPHTLVIFSDMIEQGKLDFTTADLTPPEPVIEALEKDGLAPKLDADVYVAGITAGQAQTYSVPQERFNAITKFWAAYFARAGARLGPYDRDLLDFRLEG